MINTGFFYITTFKIALLLGGANYLKFINPKIIKKHGMQNPLMAYFILFQILQFISVFQNHSLSTSQKLNYILIIIATISIVYGTVYRMIYEKNEFSDSFFKSINIIFWISLSLASLQFILNDQIIRNVGIIPQGMAYNVFGLNYERLFLCEFLILGISVNIVNKYFWKYILAAISFLLIYKTGSITGLVGVISIIFMIRKLTVLRVVFIIVTVSSFIFIKGIYLDKLLLSDYERDYNKFRYESYFKYYDENNWRYISNLKIMSESISAENLFGHGYKANDSYLSPLYEDYIYSKHGFKLKENKNVSTHSFIAILYDQGLIGFAVFSIYLLYLIVYSVKIYRFSPKSSHFFLGRFICVLNSLVILRYLFYYHSIIHWHFILSTILTVYYYTHLYKNKTGNTFEKNTHYIP